VPSSGNEDDDLRCVLQWASEANSQVCAFVLNPDPEGTELKGSYSDGAAPIVKDLIGRAARRFANLMDSMAASSAFVDQGRDRRIDL
jgi:hypothetical protein